MRPEKLTLQGFATYCDKTEIDFTLLGKKGLYLITGDTGAGKTTIFDAIMYALFGIPTGSLRKEGMLRSSFADDKTPTQVELVFSYRNQRYRIKRNPTYSRQSLRGTGITEEKACAELELSDGSVITGLRPVDAKIRELLGVDENQFSQIAMIAQGEFRKVLTADTQSRQDIFRKLFKTDNFQRLQFALKDRSIQINRLYDDSKKTLVSLLERIKGGDNNSLMDLVEKGRETRALDPVLLEELEKFIEADTSLASSIEKTKNELDEKLNKIRLKTQSIQNLTLAKNTLKADEEKLSTLETQLSQAQNRLEEEKSKDRKILEDQAAILQEKLGDYDQLEEKENALEKLDQDIAENESTFSQIAGDLKTKTDEVASQEKEIHALADSGAALEKARSELEKLRNQYKDLDSLEKSLKELEENKKDYEVKKTEYDKAMENKLSASRQFDALFCAFNEAQAGFLAKDLKEGSPCPVCGSTSHPHLATLSDQAPSQAELEDAKEKRSVAENTALDKASLLKEISGKVEESQKQILATLKELLGEVKLDEAFDKVLSEKEDVSNRGKEVSGEVKALEESNQRKEKLEEELAANKRDVEALNSKREEILPRLEGMKAQKKSDSKQIEEIKAGLDFSSREEAQNHLTTLNSQIDSMKADLEEAQNQYTTALSSVKETKGSITSQKAHIQSLEKEVEEGLSLETLNQQESELSDQKEKIQREDKEVFNRQESNREVLQALKDNEKDREELSRKYALVSALSDTANGRISGKAKIELETYVQMTYFDRIIKRANLRFMIMSRGQFELIRREESGMVSKSGLELDVVDHYNGGKRPVQSLSGGESFEASLALALGLSDEIQCSSGGIQLDCMFVDEGFGSLDSQNLEQAVRALESVSQGNKLVGIISHVDELENKIGPKIIVTKDKGKSSHARVEV